jgi:hypothetical protein
MNCSECKNVLKRIDNSMDALICVKCGWTFNPDLTKRVNVGKTDPASKRPSLPEKNVTLGDIVIDFYQDDSGEWVFASRTYIPKEEVEEKPFDPDDNTFQFYLRHHRKRFKNRRRYRYERERKLNDMPI